MLARTNLKHRGQYDFGDQSFECRIQPSKGGSPGEVCHNCLNGNNYSRKIRCQNKEVVRDPAATVQCNKCFGERCLEFWYGMDNDVMEFLLSGKTTSEGGTGTGLGLGLFEGV
jgi:hypothetical protein